MGRQPDALSYALMNRTLRRFAACIALLALGFAQMAVSAYACPRDLESAGPSVAIASDMESCPELANANLCASHCDYGTSAVATHGDSLPPADLAAMPWRFAPALRLGAQQCIPRVHTASGAAPPPTRLTPLRI